MTRAGLATAAALVVALGVVCWPGRPPASVERVIGAGPPAPGGPVLGSGGGSWLSGRWALRGWARRRWGLRGWGLHRRQVALSCGVIAALDLVAAGLRAGLPPARALELALAEVRDDPGGRVLAEALTSDGLLDAAALDRAAHVPQLALVAQAWALSATCGVSLAAAVETAARMLRDELALSRRTEVVLAGPRATARLLAGLPLVGLAVAAAFGVDPVQLYAGHPVSRVCLVAGFVLVMFGRWWTGRLVAAVGR